MPSKKTASLCFTALILFTAAWVATAQDVQNSPSTPQASSKELSTKKDQAVPCSTFLSGCQNTLKKRNEQIQALELETLRLSEEIVRFQQKTQKQKDEIEKLRPQAALPTCAGSNGELWLHPTIPTVACTPYVCGATPFSCKRSCNTTLDCVSGLVCSADALCIPKPKQK